MGFLQVDRLIKSVHYELKDKHYQKFLKIKFNIWTQQKNGEDKEWVSLKMEQYKLLNIKLIKKNKDLRNLLSGSRKSNIHVIKDPEEEEKDDSAEKIFIERMPKIFQILQVT